MPSDAVASTRRRRRRYRLRRLVPVGALALAAFAAGAWTGGRHTAATHPVAGAGSAAAGTPVLPATTATTPVTPLDLVHGPPTLAGQLKTKLLAASAILVDADTGQELWALHPHQRRPVASTTKIMTALLALKALAPNDVITVDRAVTRVPLVREGLHTGEQVRAWKLFYAMLLYSGNDDALQLALAAAGSKEAFLQQMNAEAERLGMRDTHFTSPSGVIDAGNYSSAWDLAALTRVALRNPRFAQIVKTPRIEVPWSAPINSKIYVNNNSLLRLYPGANGVKTGFTHAAGWCLVASATRRGHTLIAVVLDSGNIYADAEALLDLGFRSFS